jgi:hypothetical protein
MSDSTNTKLVFAVATWRARRPSKYSPERWRSVSTLEDQDVARRLEISSRGLPFEIAANRKTLKSPDWLTNGGSGILPHEVSSIANAIGRSAFKANDPISSNHPGTCGAQRPVTVTTGEATECKITLARENGKWGGGSLEQKLGVFIHFPLNVVVKGIYD